MCKIIITNYTDRPYFLQVLKLECVDTELILTLLGNVQHSFVIALFFGSSLINDVLSILETINVFFLRQVWITGDSGYRASTVHLFIKLISTEKLSRHCLGFILFLWKVRRHHLS